MIKRKLNDIVNPKKKILCTECNRSFVKFGEHKKSHNPEKKYICDICKHAFKRKKELDAHRAIHFQEKKYSCNICGLKFILKKRLYHHNRVHEEKKYKCEECGYACVRSDMLKSHILTHNNSKLFACEHCSYTNNNRGYMNIHEQMHEIQKSYKFECEMEEYGCQKFTNIKCTIRCKNEMDMERHIERNHTPSGIGQKFHSETKLAEFLKLNDIPYERDWNNLIHFKYCVGIQGNKISARPDFFLPIESVRLNCVFILCNNEHGHRYNYPCEFQRINNITTALYQTTEFNGLPVVFIMFNPHHYRMDDIYCNRSLKNGHHLLLQTIQSITKEMLKPGINLVYIQYDHNNNKLDVFEGDDDYIKEYKHCLLLDIF